MNIESISSESLSKEMAYLFGVYLTDGCITGEGKFILQVIDKDFAEQTLKCIKAVYPTCTAEVWERENTKGKWNKNTQYCISCGFTSLKPFFEQQTGKKHHVPYIIWGAPRIVQKWFVAGIMDGDGYITKTKRKNGKYSYKIGVGKVEDGWILEFEELLHKLGVKTGKRQRSLTKNGVPFICLVIKNNSFLENGLFFTIGRKKERVTLLRNVQRLKATHLKG